MLLSDEVRMLMTEVTGMNTPPSIMQRVATNVKSSIENAHDSQACFRASSIGKPWILQVLGRWYPSEPVFSVSTCMKMLDGINAQAWAEEILNLAQMDFKSEEEFRLPLGGEEVVGHSDIIVTNHSTRQKTVIECKSMAGHIIKKFYDSPHDDMGYISQLAFYTMMARKTYPTYTVEPMFLLFDRSMGVFKTCHIVDHIIKEKFNRVEEALERVASVPRFNFEALLDTVLIPPPIGGNIPPSMKWSKWAKAFYYEENREAKLHEKATSIKLLENMTQNKLGGL